MITAVGLGYNRGDVSVRGWRAIKKAATLCVRTLESPAGRALKRYNPIAFDALYRTAENFDELNLAIAERVAALGDVVYCTDGCGEDGAVKALRAKGLPVEVIPGAAAGSGLTISASELCAQCPYLDTLADLTVTELDDGLLAGETKLKLLRFYAPQTVCRFTIGGKTREIPLEALDRQKKYGVDAAIRIAGSDALDKPVSGFGDLMRIMDRLTAPDGCPWDKAQTHASIRQNLIEEAYEAVDAIDADDPAAMTEELGDVLMQAVFHCNIAERAGEFELSDVISGLNTKLYTRHTHIFGSVKASDAGEALGAWENAKAVEKQYTSLYDVLSRLPKGFPSALKIGKAVKKAVKYGADIDPETLVTEAVGALKRGDLTAAAFAVIAAFALNGEEPETALNRAAAAFIERFKA